MCLFALALLYNGGGLLSCKIYRYKHILTPGVSFALPLRLSHGHVGCAGFLFHFIVSISKLEKNDKDRMFSNYYSKQVTVLCLKLYFGIDGAASYCLFIMQLLGQQIHFHWEMFFVMPFPISF